MSEWAKIANELRFIANHSLAYTMVIELKDAELLVAAAKGIELLDKRAEHAEAAVVTMVRQEFLLRKEIKRLTKCSEEGVSAETFTLPMADYELLISCAQADDMIVECETCGAWLHRRSDDACASTEDYTGCWKVATQDPALDHLCKSYRATK